MQTSDALFFKNHRPSGAKTCHSIDKQVQNQYALSNSLKKSLIGLQQWRLVSKLVSTIQTFANLRSKVSAVDVFELQMGDEAQNALIRSWRDFLIPQHSSKVALSSSARDCAAEQFAMLLLGNYVHLTSHSTPTLCQAVSFNSARRYSREMPSPTRCYA